MQHFIFVGLGGFLGATSRYSIGLATKHLWGDQIPYGTFIVNVLGCLLIGIAISFIEAKELASPALRLFVVIGFLGSFTTFSSFGSETLDLFNRPAIGLAVGNVILNVSACLIAVYLGRLLYLKCF